MNARGQLKGRRMLVKLLDGTKFVDVFEDNSSRHVLFKEHGRVRTDAIKKMTPYVEPRYTWVRTRQPEEFDEKQARDFPELCPLRNWHAGDGYKTCVMALNADGVCTEHGHVRRSPHYRPERKEENEPTMRYTPPRRAGGKTRPYRSHGYYWA